MTPPPRHLLTVALGGAVGAGLRQALVLAWPPHGWDAVVLTINVVGAFALAVLLTWLAGTGPDEGRRRDARLLLGTGVLGGFTTYSTLAVDTAMLLRSGDAGMAAGYALLTVGLGAAASLLGIRCGTGLLGIRPTGRRGAPQPHAPGAEEAP
ncbi:fluoride efflux transporter FluC [Arsenicicoccus dermatophilus]|uniref:fluoride efflux transporter FluC n=1 Tax=Arsenicicoccus dermatophilus TaxID=1076331 RepID=UPI001F4D26F3|nr:CrcB family protein [Arsenicicoccus dermatophilus]